MKRNKFYVIALLSLFSCTKSTTPTNEPDVSKLVNKNWYWGGKSLPQLITINFNSNDTALLTQCIWTIPPYKYDVIKYKWNLLGKDSINLDGYHFKIYSVNDSILITNNWVVGTAGSGPDTTHTTFKTY